MVTGHRQFTWAQIALFNSRVMQVSCIIFSHISTSILCKTGVNLKLIAKETNSADFVSSMCPEYQVKSCGDFHWGNVIKIQDGRQKIWKIRNICQIINLFDMLKEQKLFIKLNYINMPNLKIIH